ncbi:hypothetical protein A3J90_04285 [candidate division WOR-1 bacterium RIFOXYC2_FULL_37_10]|uniref:Uncharacterized protein n=1 Tax=candidate division WOR-1 bacterium RIFOXYB2_FULL_37_13 TaxID=1802579 RepID=A0A1F4SY32_UNCSA|nr:MAG: hypothetical protein A2310_08975 [candidate division WOR-1 bacterium RIFOXYB2_FULL_37_13]OGC34154.1 MAG: hypothetical protein A3J90_04285 [candidate division WOR-1 bacterium RIFOXYC2_FULL_37_10]
MHCLSVRDAADIVSSMARALRGADQVPKLLDRLVSLDDEMITAKAHAIVALVERLSDDQ